MCPFHLGFTQIDWSVSASDESGIVCGPFGSVTLLRAPPCLVGFKGMPKATIFGDPTHTHFQVSSNSE